MAMFTVVAIGLGCIGAIVYFGMFLFKGRESMLFDNPLFHRSFEYWEKNGSRYNLPRYARDIFSELLERRNEFWTSYGQLIIAALIIIVLTILLLTKTITAEAGLPILSAISGFAIAKGVTSGRTGSNGSDNQG
jgi:hypothetical protein